MADRYAIVRSVYHREAPIHETGQQLLQTGRLSSNGEDWPHPGAVLGRLQPANSPFPAWVVVPKSIGNTGVSSSHGQTAGFLGTCHEPVVMDVNHMAESDAVRSRYGWNSFGQSCLLARRLVQNGARMVTVNMFNTVFGKITWDCHANGSDLNTTLADYKDVLCPMLDTAYTALLDDLYNSGLLDTTLVVCAGEFGRTPKLNRHGGRDHWPRVWSVLLAGGGVRGGQVIGASDSDGAEPKDQPVHAAEIVATVYHALGVDANKQISGPERHKVSVVDVQPVLELF